MGTRSGGTEIDGDQLHNLNMTNNDNRGRIIAAGVFEWVPSQILYAIGTPPLNDRTSMVAAMGSMEPNLRIRDP